MQRALYTIRTIMVGLCLTGSIGPLTWVNTATGAPVADSLRITEIMYHPLDSNQPDDPNTEYIELQNIGPDAINLDLVRFLDGVDFAFPPLELAPEEFVLVVRNQAAFDTYYGSGFNIAGQYQGSLANNGEALLLVDATGYIIESFEYSDNWFDLTDGQGFSLTARPEALYDPNAYLIFNNKSAWQPSSYLRGSPGAADPGRIPAPGSIVINEILAHSHAEDTDWIELHNTTDQPIDISGWFLSDEPDNPAMYRIAADTVVDANGYALFYETDHFGNPDDPGALKTFALSEEGETLFLRSAERGALTGYAVRETFGPSNTGVSMGRYEKSIDTFNFVALTEPTPGYANAAPLVGPVVISEIMYHPADNGSAEYVELTNITDHTVVLYNETEDVGWRFTDNPDDPGIDLILPSNPPVQLAAGERLLLVADNAAVSSEYTIPTDVQVFAWPDGKLSNAGEKIQLSRPGEMLQDGTRLWFRVDRINFSDGSHHSDFDSGLDPWPVSADGEGNALHRIDLNQYGNDPVNWMANVPSPGR